MKILVQDTTQQRADSITPAATTTATTAAQPPRMGPPQNVGYLQAVFVEAVLLFGGYWLLLHRRSAKLRARAASMRSGR